MGERGDNASALIRALRVDSQNKGFQPSKYYVEEKNGMEYVVKEKPDGERVLYPVTDRFVERFLGVEM